METDRVGDILMIKFAFILILLVESPLAFGQFAASPSSTATQAVLSYSTLPADTCTIQVSESPSLQPLVNDVNPTLFAAADHDSQRPTTLVNDSHRQLTIGARTSSVATDGKLYSRALQAFTTHYYALTCSSGTATGQFTTLNPPLGETAVEPPPFDAAGFGNYAWPTIDWTDINKLYIEPRTGIAYKRLSKPDWKGQVQDVTFLNPIDLNSAWTNPQNANSGKSATTAAYSGAANDPLFLPLDAQHSNPWGVSLGYNPAVSIDDAVFRCFGSGSSSAAADRTVSVCWSMDSGATCLTPEKQVVLPASSGAGTTWPANGTPAPLWQSWTPVPLTRDQYDGSYWTVNTNGASVTLIPSPYAGTYFGVNQVAGTKILINGVVYTIAARNSSSSLTLTSSAGTQTGVNYNSLTTGFRIRKTTANGTINFSASASLAVGQMLSTGLNGSTPYCSNVPQTVTVDASGTPAPPRAAYLCTNNKPNVGDGVQSVMFAFFPDNAEARLLSNWSLQPNAFTTRKWLLANGTPAPAPDIPGMNGTPLATWGPDGRSLFARVDLSNGDIGLAKITYTGVFQEYRPGYSYTSQDSLVYTNLTPVSQAKGIRAQITAANVPHWFSKAYPVVNLVGPSGSSFIFVLASIGQGGQGYEAPAFVAAMDTTGTLQWVADMYSTYPVRFEGFHNMEQHAGYNGVISNRLYPGKGVYTGGPFLLGIPQINSNGTWRGAGQSNTDTSLNYTDALACPAGLPSWLTSTQITGVGGASGNTCIQIRAKEPCSPTPYSFSAGDPANEAANYPCPWDPAQSMLASLVPGDEFVDLAGAPGTNPYEHFRVLTKTVFSGSGPGAVFEMWLQRFAGPNGGTTDLAYCNQGQSGNCTHASGWQAFMVQPLSSSVSWFWIDPSGNKMVDTQYPSNGHPDFGLGPTGGYTAVTGGGGISSLDYTIRFDTPMNTQIGKQPDYLLKGPPTFHGTNHGGGSGESYISMQQTATNLPQERRWFLDFNPEQNGVGVSTGESKSSWAAQAYSLVAGTSSVYKLNSGLVGTVDYKSTPFFLWAGRYTFHDISSPGAGNTVTDSTPWAFCYALNAGECRAGSALGDLYFSAPGADNDGTCYVDWYSQSFPCITVPFPNSAQMVQRDTSQPDQLGVRFRKLGMGFAGPGRVYQFANVFSDPTGQWGMFICYWCSGVRNELFALKLPPWPIEENQTKNRSDYIPTPVSYSRNASLPNLRVKFGYAEYGNVSDFFCSPRREACVTDQHIAPYAYASTETLTPISCRSVECTLTVPGLSGRVMYYREERLDSAGNVQFSGPITALAIPSGKTR